MVGVALLQLVDHVLLGLLGKSVDALAGCVFLGCSVRQNLKEAAILVQVGLRLEHELPILDCYPSESALRKVHQVFGGLTMAN